MKKRCGWFLMLVFVWSILLSGTAFADIGPKPSVVIDFTGLEGRTYYATLLSDRDVMGPWEKDGDYIDWMGERAIFDAFAAYTDAEGFYFLSWMQDCTETHRLDWNYYPPQRFQVLLYFPEEGVFQTDHRIYERYAFDSYFTIDVAEGDFSCEKSYDFRWEILSLCCRILATIAIELAIAWLFFGYRSKKQLKIIGITNILTQTGLNFLLNFVHYQGGAMLFVLCYILLEILVFAAEGAIYTRYLCSDEKKTHLIFYAFVANSVSFAIGFGIAKVLPGIF